MNSALFVVVVISVAAHVVLAGAGVDRVLVEMPARKKIGALAFAHYLRAKDLGNGRVVYPLAGILGWVSALVALGVAVITRTSQEVLIALAVAAASAIAGIALTTQAAPTMFQIGRSPDREEAVGPLIERFASLGNWRALSQVVTLVALEWALLL